MPTNKRVKKAVIPAAGLGSRFLPATKAIPKEMLPILDKPTIQYIVEEALSSGIEDILIITARNKGAIENHFDNNPELERTLEKKGKTELLQKVKAVARMNIHYIRQKEPLGLGHAVLQAEKFIQDDTFAVLLGDAVVDNNNGPPCLKQLIEVYHQTNKSVIGARKVPREDVSKYALIDITDDNVRDEQNTSDEHNTSDRYNTCDTDGDRTDKTDRTAYRIRGLLEKPSPKQLPPIEREQHLVTMGRYVLTPQIFYHLKNTLVDNSGEIQLTSALDTLSRTGGAYAYPIQGTRYDTGEMQGYLKAILDFAHKRED